MILNNILGFVHEALKKSTSFCYILRKVKKIVWTMIKLDSEGMDYAAGFVREVLMDVLGTSLCETGSPLESITQ